MMTVVVSGTYVDGERETAALCERGVDARLVVGSVRRIEGTEADEWVVVGELPEPIQRCVVYNARKNGAPVRFVA